ncbi:glutaredoxin family protein [bacterium]|nr:glutaredoxin family protein [bacterium]
MKKVTIYTLDYCPYCKKAKKILRDKNIPFNEIDVTSNEYSQSKMLEEKYDIQDDVTFPQIIIGEKRIGGCSDLEYLIEKNQLELELKEE